MLKQKQSTQKLDDIDDLSGNMRTKNARAHTGNTGPPAFTFDGYIDEVRISDIARSQAWIQTEYNNQQDPSSFYTIGSKETSATVFVSPSAVNVYLGEELTVNIDLSFAPNLYGYEIWLSFNNSVLNATAIDYRNFLNEPKLIWHQEVNNTGGYAALAVSNLHPASAKTGGSPPPLATVHFKSVGLGISPLHLHKTILADNNGIAIPHQTVDGQVICSEKPNTPPVAGNLSISPSLPVTTDDLIGSYDYYDADGDPENGTEIRWYKDDVIQLGLNNTLTVLSSLTTKFETWYFTVKPKDGIDFGTLKTSPSVTIQNSPPTIDSFTPTDTTPEVDEGESIEFTHTSSDPDNDPLTYSWLLDSIEQATTQNWTYSPGYDDAGIHNVTLTVSDGELIDSQEWNVTVINVNRPPSIDSYYPLTDSTITEGESQEFNITYSDPDVDPITVQWYLNGTPTVTTNSYIFIAYYGSAGSYNVTVIISDGFAQTSHEWTLTVRLRVKIVEVTPCNAIGNPKNTFARGTLAYFKVVVNNTGSEAVNILITVNTYDSDGVTIGVASFQGPISSGVTTFILGLPIPTIANLGEATVYSSAFTNWIHNGGVPYCPELSATFEIE